MSTLIKILNKVDIKAFESAPEFNAADRKKYFYPSKWSKKTMAELKCESDTNKVVFFLMCG